MRQRLFFALTIGLYIFFASACRAPTPVIIVVTATPAPAQPTLTPLPVLPSATPPPPPTALAPTISATPTNIPPPQPTATPILAQLSVFDQGGGNMGIYFFGTSLATTRLAFRAVLCVPNCETQPDGKDVESAKFLIFKPTPQGTLQLIYEYNDAVAPYCPFENCAALDIASPSAKFPKTQTVIENGDYVLAVDALGKRSASCSAKVRFRVQR